MKEARGCGATGVKLYHSFDAPFLKKVVTAAKKNNLKVWGHAMMYPAKPAEVIAAGVEVVSHAYMLESLVDDPRLSDRKLSKSSKDSIRCAIDVSKLAKSMYRKNVILDATLCLSLNKDP